MTTLAPGQPTILLAFPTRERMVTEDVVAEFVTEVPLVRRFGLCPSTVAGEHPITHVCFKHLGHDTSHRCACGQRWPVETANAPD